MGFSYCGKWLQNPVSAASASLCQSPYDCGKGPSPGADFGQRDFNLPAKEAIMRVDSSELQGFTAHIFSFPKKDGHLHGTKRLRRVTAFQDADHQRNSPLRRASTSIYWSWQWSNWPWWQWSSSSRAGMSKQLLPCVPHKSPGGHQSRSLSLSGQEALAVGVGSREGESGSRSPIQADGGESTP